MTKLLNEYGEDLNDYVFIDDLDAALDFYTSSDSTGGTDTSGIDLSSYMAILSQLLKTVFSSTVNGVETQYTLPS